MGSEAKMIKSKVFERQQINQIFGVDVLIGRLFLFIMHRMKAYSEKSTSKQAPPCSQAILQRSLQKTALCFSLDHHFQSEKNIDKMASGEDCELKKKLTEIGFDKEEEHVQQYYRKGMNEMKELAEYYKYYTQTSINYQPAFYKSMHNHREQRKALEYNRLKFMLDLSNSTHTESSKTHRLQNSLASSFRLLSRLQSTRNEESVLFQGLKDKLQLDYGPSKYTTVEELDKQYCFSKTVDLTMSKQKAKPRRPSRKVTKHTLEKQSPLFRRKVNNYTRNNSCGNLSQQTTRKTESTCKVKHKKFGSMDNLNSLGNKPRERKETFPKESKDVYLKENKDSDIKKKIMGMKEQIRKEKALMIRQNESTRGKKASGLARRMRT